MPNVEIYPSLKDYRASKSSPGVRNRTNGRGATSEDATSQILDRVGFALFVTSAVALIIIFSFYFFAKQPDRKAIVLAFNDINLALEESLNSISIQENLIKESSGPQVISYVLPDNFAAVRSDPRRASAYDHYLTQIRFISKVIQNRTKKPTGSNLAQIIVKESIKHGYDPLFVTAVIMAESGFNKKAISPVGALGLMQLLPATAKYIATKMGDEYWKGHRLLLHDESYNIQLGVSYLKYLDQKFGGDKRLTLAAYNWGPGNLQKSMNRGSNKLPSETSRYRDSILRNYTKWSNEFRAIRRKELNNQLVG